MILSHTCYKEDHQLSDEILSRLKNENIFDKMNNFPYFVPISSPIVSFSLSLCRQDYILWLDKATLYNFDDKSCHILQNGIFFFYTAVVVLRAENICVQKIFDF